MPNISGLYTALSGMNAQRRVLDVTAHNVANQATEGYHRQRVDLRAVGVSDVATVFAGQDIRVGGVDATAVTRMIDNLAEDRALRQTATYGGTQTMRANLDQIEMTFPEPSENGIAAQLDELWASWSDLSSAPDSPVVRSQLLDRARGVIDALGRASADLNGVSDSAARQVPSMANEVNNLAGRIAELNQAIV
ncbi:MAG: flagellar hook-associated protein FlgK, partial [Ilumatobacter sp.]